MERRFFSVVSKLRGAATPCIFIAPGGYGDAGGAGVSLSLAGTDAPLVSRSTAAIEHRQVNPAEITEVTHAPDRRQTFVALSGPLWVTRRPAWPAVLATAGWVKIHSTFGDNSVVCPAMFSTSLGQAVSFSRVANSPGLHS
jgi:hypothetical protein